MCCIKSIRIIVCVVFFLFHILLKNILYDAFVITDEYNLKN